MVKNTTISVHNNRHKHHHIEQSAALQSNVNKIQKECNLTNLLINNNIKRISTSQHRRQSFGVPGVWTLQFLPCGATYVDPENF